MPFAHPSLCRAAVAVNGHCGLPHLLEQCQAVHDGKELAYVVGGTFERPFVEYHFTGRSPHTAVFHCSRVPTASCVHCKAFKYDVGKCGKIKCAEAELSILAKASVEKDNHITTDVTLETSKGQITQFKVRNKLGENFMIIGLPNEIFGQKAPRSETVIFMVPRLIKTLKTTETIKNRI